MHIGEIKTAIKNQYILGAYNETNIVYFKNIIHPEFAIIDIQNDGTFYLFTRDMWEKILKERLDDVNFDYSTVAFTPHFRSIDVQGPNASVSLDLLLRGQIYYSEFLLLKQIDLQWIIVSKIFHQHVQQ